MTALAAAPAPPLLERFGGARAGGRRRGRREREISGLGAGRRSAPIAVGLGFLGVGGRGGSDMEANGSQGTSGSANDSQHDPG